MARRLYSKGNIVRRNVAFFFAVTAMLFASEVSSSADFPNGVAYDLPGVRFCPAPGCDNGDFLDTYYSVDAKTGQLTVHTGDTSRPAAPGERADGGEVTLYSAPGTGYDSTFSAREGTIRADRAYANPNPAYGRDRLDVQSPVAGHADQDGRELVANDDDKVPWWKGGMWRNRKSGDDDKDNSSSSSSKSSSSSSSSGTARAPRMTDDDDMWDDEDNGEYSGYNADGSFGRPAAAPRQQANSRQPAPRRAPADDPFSAPQPSGGYGGGGYGGSAGGYDTGYSSGQQTYSDPYASQPQMGQVYSDPYAAPAPQYDPYSGSNYAGGPVDTSMYGGTTVYNDEGTSSFLSGTPYASDPYGATTYSAPGYDAPTYTAPQQDPFANAAPVSYQGEPTLDAQGSPQFENAVRLVKDNRFSEAKSILTSETSRNPSNASAWRWLADCHYNLLELDDAINCYQRALERDPNDYYALRGQGFSYLHRGHEYWRQMQEQVSRGQKEAAATTFAQAHDNYKKSLELLGLCLRRSPTDGEAVYGEAMAAEGASRKLYSNAISYLKLGPDQRERAELFAENCVSVINKGIERSKEKAKESPGDAGPRALLGGLYLRKAILYNQLGRNDQALIELRNSRDVQKSILDEIDKNNATAQRNLRETESYWEQWGGNRQ